MNQGVLLEFLNMGGGEIALIMVAVLLLFGGKKLPELARGLGKGIREFKDASEGVKREIHKNINAVDTEEPALTVEEMRLRNHPIVDVAETPVVDVVEHQYQSTVVEPIEEKVETTVINEEVKPKETHS